MTDDLVTRLRKWAFKFCGKGEQEDFASNAMSEAADHIEHLERELGEERHSREVAAAKGWELSDRIKELEFVLSFIANINYGNGPDVNMEHQGWAKRALEGSKPK